MKEKVIAIIILVLCIGTIVIGVYLIIDDGYLRSNLDQLLSVLAITGLIPIMIIYYIIKTNFGKPITSAIVDKKTEIKKLELANRILELKIKQNKLSDELNSKIEV